MPNYTCKTKIEIFNDLKIESIAAFVRQDIDQLEKIKNELDRITIDTEEDYVMLGQPISIFKGIVKSYLNYYHNDYVKSAGVWL